MITLIEGKPGAGKSYEATTLHVLDALIKKDKKEGEETKFKNLINAIKDLLPKKNDKEEKGRYIVTNLPLNLEHIEAEGYDTKYIVKLEEGVVDGKIYKPFARLDDYQKHENLKVNKLGPLYVIDECHEVMPHVPRSDDSYRDIEEWYAMHRHLSADVVLLTQDAKKLNRNIAGLAQTIKKLKKLNHFGLNSSYKVFFKDDPFTKDSVYRSVVRKYDKNNFKYYQSYTKGGNGEADIQDQKPVWRNWKVYIFVPFFFWSIFNLFDKKPWAFFDNLETTGEQQQETQSEQEIQSDQQSVGELTSRPVYVPTPIQQKKPEPKACNHLLNDYDIYFSHKYQGNFYFRLVRDVYRSDIVSLAYLKRIGYSVEDMSFFHEQAQLAYEMTDTYPAMKLVKTGKTVGNFYATFSHEECDYSAYITHNRPPQLLEHDTKRLHGGGNPQGGTDRETSINGPTPVSGGLENLFNK